MTEFYRTYSCRHVYADIFMRTHNGQNILSFPYFPHWHSINQKYRKVRRRHLIKKRSKKAALKSKDSRNFPTLDESLMWGSAKWRNKKHRGTARHHLESYFAEFMWRKMIDDGNVFEEVMIAWGKCWELE